jgi:hypothetical protein
MLIANIIKYCQLHMSFFAVIAQLILNDQIPTIRVMNLTFLPSYHELHDRYIARKSVEIKSRELISKSFLLLAPCPKLPAFCSLLPAPCSLQSFFTSAIGPA